MLSAKQAALQDAQVLQLESVRQSRKASKAPKDSADQEDALYRSNDSKQGAEKAKSHFESLNNV